MADHSYDGLGAQILDVRVALSLPGALNWWPDRVVFLHTYLSAVLDVLPNEDHFRHSLVSIPSSKIEYYLAVGVWFVSVNVVPSQKNFHHTLVSIISSPPEWCLTVVIWYAGVDVVRC